MLNEFSLMFDLQHAQMSYQCWWLIDLKCVDLRWAIVLIICFLEIVVDVNGQIVMANNLRFRLSRS